MISLYRRAPSLPRRTLIFRATPILTLHPCVDPEWSLYRMGLNLRVAPGRTRNHLPLPKLKHHLHHKVLSSFIPPYHSILFSFHLYRCHSSPSYPHLSCRLLKQHFSLVLSHESLFFIQQPEWSFWNSGQIMSPTGVWWRGTRQHD